MATYEYDLIVPMITIMVFLPQKSGQGEHVYHAWVKPCACRELNAIFHIFLFGA
jgi:hypothetical protein